MEIRRPLKRALPKLGPPDIYPQDPKQKEDELTSVNVKQGYTSAPLISGQQTLDEFGTAKNANIDAFGVYFSALLSEKHRINTLKDTQKKKQLVNTKEIWYVHAKTKHAVDNWFRDLANGTKSLGQLGKRIPIFNSKEGMFSQLYESHVPLAKAVWFIKMSAVHAIALSESSSKSKKRQVPDQYQELTAALTKYLKEISIRLIDCYQQSQHHIQQMQQHHHNQQQPQTNANINTQQSGQTNLGSNNNSQSILQQRNNTTLALSATTTTTTTATTLTSTTITNKPSLLSQQMTSSKSTPSLAGPNFHYTTNSHTSSLLNHQPNFTANLHTSVATLMTSQTASAVSLSASSITSLPIMHEDFIPTYNQWQYQTRLARNLFDEGLLDQYDFLCFLLELIEKKRPINDLVVKVICPLVLEYVIDFSRSAVLSRRLAYVCAKKLCQALHHHPMSARSMRRNELAQQQYLSQHQSSTNTNGLNNLGFSEGLMAKQFLAGAANTSVGASNKYNQFDSRITDTQSSSLLRNSSSTANNNHLTANSILDIVKAQISESQNNFFESLTIDQENSENNLYKNAIYILSSILQVICIECPTAMVRHHIVDAKFPTIFQGSPLDHLPCLPSILPMMESDLNFELRKSIHDAEREILHRSAMADSKWSCDSSSGVESSKGNLVNRLLTVMDILDKHNFDKIDSINTIDILYPKIFPSKTANTQPTATDTGNNPPTNTGVLDLSSTSSMFNQFNAVEQHNKKASKSTSQQMTAQATGNVNNSNQQQHDMAEKLTSSNSYEEQVIKLLCEWATTTQRTGEHRAIVVARLLERRQSELQANLPEQLVKMTESLTAASSSKTAKKSEDTKPVDNQQKGVDLNQSDASQDKDQEEIVHFSFQDLLVQFLDENAPVIDEAQDQDTLENKKAFNNLVLLFSELIRCDVFSHYNYMCTLISRGMFNDLSKKNSGSGNSDGPNLDSPVTNSILNPPGSVKQPKSVGRESDSILASTMQGLVGGSNIYPLTVSTNTGNQSNHLDQLGVSSKLGSGADQSLRSLGFSPVSSQQNVPQNLDKGHGLLDNHIDDVDADLGKILQDIKEGQQDEAADILLPDYLGGSMREEGNNKSQQINKLSPFDLGDRSSALDDRAQNPSSVISGNNFSSGPVDRKPSIGSTTGNSSEDKQSNKNPSERRHMTFVKHFPVPDDDNFMHDINQRNILLYGFGKEREEARHTMRKLNKEICKLFHRKANRDINDGGKIKKLPMREGFHPETTLHKFETLNHHDQHTITNSLAMTIIEMFTGVSNGQTSLLPTLESLSFVFDLYTIASNVSGLIELVVPVLEELPDVEAQIKLKCPLLANQYTHSVALCIIGMLYRYHSCVLLLSKDELCSVFESLQKLVSHISNPAICTTSNERVIFYYLYDLYSTQTSGRFFDQYSGFVQRIKQTLLCQPNINYDNVEHEWTQTILTNIVGQLRASANLCSNSSMNPVINASSGLSTMSSFTQISANDTTALIRQHLYLPDSVTIRQLNDSSVARYRFVCDAIFLSATSPYPDLVNDVAVLCADVTSKCPALIGDWIHALQALCCSAQRELNYRQLLSKIIISDPQVMDNIAIFTAILVARRCLELGDFIIKCAIGAILAPLGSVDKQSTEPGVRLTCHLLLTLFRNRESPMNQARNSQSTSLNTHNAFGQTFPNYGNCTPNYGSNLLGMGLLQPISKDMDGNSKTPLCLKYLCDHHLLRSACCSIKTECHITLLKAIRVLAMWASPSSDTVEAPIGRVKQENHFDDVSMDGLGNIGKDLDTHTDSPNILSSDSSFNLKHINLQTASLHQFADAILRLLCSQRWLHDKCLSDSELFTTIDTEKNILLDPRIDVKQSQRLLYMICYNKSPEKQADVGLDDQGSDQVASIVKMFENLDVWSMRLSLMRLQFMFAYCKSQSNVMLNDWLDNLAKAVVEFFQKTSQESENQDKDNNNIVGGNGESVNSNDDTKNSKKQANNKSHGGSSSITNINKVWLIEPLLDKLTKPPSAVQSKIIKASAALMESASVRANSLPSLNQTYLSTAAASTKFKERTLSQRGSASTNPSNLASTSLLGFQPFLSLLLSCLRSQDKERETLLTSLNSQLYQAIHEKVDDIGYKQSLQDGLELRLCLIGQMFDTIQKSTNLTSDWATLLLLLIMNNLVDPQVDYGLYVSVLDMLATLIHAAYTSDPIEQKEESKKQYQNLMKKFRKELTAMEEKGFIQMKLINPLMPLVRQMTEVITCEPMGSLVDTKGEKVENFYSIDKKKGLKVSELQEVSPWDLIEGHKNPAPLSWPWFGAIRLEQKPQRADENNRLMSWHTHTVRHTTAYFCQVPAIDEGPSSAKRSNSEKNASQRNPLLKSLIEASDPSESSSILSSSKKDHHSHQTGGESSTQGRIDEEGRCSTTPDEPYIGREDLLEDYCELPLDLLFDSAPVESMIEDIKSAIQAEHAAMLARNKPPSQTVQPVDIKPHMGSLNSSQASSILAPIQDLNRSPQVSALSALQNHLNASSADSTGGSSSSMLLGNPPSAGPSSVGPPPSVPPMSVMSPAMVNPRTPDTMSVPPPARPPSNIPKITPTPPPMGLGNRSMSPMVIARSPALMVPNAAPTPPPKPKAPRRKRATKKETQAAAAAAQALVVDANANLQPGMQQVIKQQVVGGPSGQQMNMIPSTMPGYSNSLDQGPMNHAGGPPQMGSKMVPPGPQPMHQMQQQPPGMIMRRAAPMSQQQQVATQQQQQQHSSVYDFQYQPQQNNQFVNNGPMGSYYEHGGPNVPMFQTKQPQQQAPNQIQLGPMQGQHQHQMAPQGQPGPPPPPQQQHIQQHPHQQIQYQPQGQLQHAPPPHQPQQPHPQHMQQPQQIRLTGHQQHPQQAISFQQLQHQQHPSQQQQQQQIFGPQQAAGHSRPALTAMLHQKHAAAGNMDNKMHFQPRFNSG